MEQHGIISENSLLSKGLQQYLELQRQAKVECIPLNEMKIPESVCIKHVQFLWIDLMQEAKGLLKLCQKILEFQPKTKVFVFGEFKDPKTIKAIFKTGIAGYLLPSSCTHSIRDAMQKADLGSPYVDPHLTEMLMDSLVQPQQSSIEKHQLTKREKQILRLIVEEYTTQEIANKLFISFCTVETHRLHLIQKMGVRNTAGLVREAVSGNLVD